MIRTFLHLVVITSILAILALSPSPPVAQAAQAVLGDRLTLSGKMKNPQGRGIKGVEVEVLINGRPVKPAGMEDHFTTGAQGSFFGDFLLPAGALDGAKVEVAAHKPNWQALPPTPVEVFPAGYDQEGRRLFKASQDFTLKRKITPAFWMATSVLLLVYVIIALELMHRTLAALLGAALVMFISYTAGTFDSRYFILSFADAIHAIDMNVIFLLMGMMIIVGVLKKTGMFQWLAYKSYAMARGKVFVLSCILMLVTAVTSAFLDNVTTMLLMIPVTIEIALTLKVNPIALLIPEVFASNVGGTATLIGDPPNILIGSYAKLSFMDFVMNLTIIVAICMVVTIIYYIYWYKKAYFQAEVKDLDRTLEFLRQEYRITDKKLLMYSLGFLAFTIFLFIIHSVLHMEPSIAALTGAMLLLAVSRGDIVEMLEHEVEWPTLVFFMALFIVVAAAEETGLIQAIAEWVAQVSRGNLTVAVLMVVWVSALASAAVDNIPFTATMLPIIAFLNTTIPGAESGVLWWALALGACFGGNGTMIGASANVVTVGLAEKAGYHISFLYYMKACFVPMLITVALASVYLLWVF
ncbi:MAG: ArsB/NhaD family transporter [Deltaproteobacteria bacterium]|nr:ArsB/NhaD family transporter [Deltaproteobacteria bacterium]